jgi:uncharacterized protein
MSMFRLPLNKNAKPTYWFPLALAFCVFSPLTASAEPASLSCDSARAQLEHTQHTLLPLKQQQQQIQRHVRAIYQELLACQTGTELSLAQQKYCTQLQEEGPKQFQAMVEAITLSYETSQQLAHQTRQVQLACPAISDETFPQIARPAQF